MSDPATPLFQPIGDYDWPKLPAQENFRLVVGRLYRMFRKRSDAPFIADDKLQQATLEMLDDVVAPPACGPLIEELEASVADWIAKPNPTPLNKLIILPPGDENGVVESWARQHGHQSLDPPDRTSLVSPVTTVLPDLGGEGVLVIPQLERWFLRHRNGLDTLRALLAAIGESDRHCLIGCNSWAWAYLAKVVGADLMLPTGLMFQAFDGDRLYRWFSELAVAETTAGVAFRFSQSGADVFAADDDDKPSDDYFAKLAAHSLGIPWVAWHMWRRSLRSNREEADENADDVPAPDDQTLWIAALDELTLPNQHQDTALFVLQALLMHGQLSAQELRLVLPVVGESTIVPALIGAGFVARQGDQLTCRPAAYPMVRLGLSAAGFSMDTL